MATKSDELFAFVLMPFDTEFDDLYQLGIKEVAAKVGVIAERVDEQKFSESVLERIYRQIDAADIVIAEMTGQNPNVFYEVGYAHAKDKLCILSTTDASDIPFDLKHRRHIIHQRSILKLGQGLTAELAWARAELEKRRKSPFRIKLSTWTDLKRTEYYDTIELTLTFDLHNDSDAGSPELDAMYLFTGDSWNFKQDGQECPKSKNEKRANSFRHFLKPPVRKLAKGGWAQLKAVGEKQIYTKTKGVESKDKYPVTGTVRVELATSAGNFEDSFPLDTVAEEFPF